MHNRTLSGAVLAAVLVGGSVAVPTAALAAPAGTEPTANLQTAAPFVSVDTPATYIPYSPLSIRGTATPNADVFIVMPGLSVRPERVRSDALGKWEFTPERVLSGNFGGNTVVVQDASGQRAQTTFDLRPNFPTATHPDAAFRPIVVDTAERTGSSTARVSGTATPGALVVVRTHGWSQGVVIAGPDGRWSTDLRTASLLAEGQWFSSVAFQQHAAGSSTATFAPLA